MNPPVAALSRIRPVLGRTWLIVLFGGAYLLSQVTILVILHPLGGSVLELQTLGFSAETVRAIFRSWQEAGLMSAYRAHFVFDDVHWVWYSGFFTALLCRLFERHAVSHRLDALLLLPLISGLLDAYENHVQHVFLAAPDFSTIVDPLPLLSTLASISKWVLVAGYLTLAGVLLARRPAASESGSAG